jgi:hypothetical protein
VEKKKQPDDLIKRDKEPSFMKKKLLLGSTVIVTLTLVLLGCSMKKPEPLSREQFQEIYETIEGETVELIEESHTDKASEIWLGMKHDINIIYYQMESEEDADELFTNMSDELDVITEDTMLSSQKGSSRYWVHCREGNYHLLKDGNVILYGTGFEDDKIELDYLFYKLGYYKYDTTYIKNQREVNEKTFGY